MIGLAPGTGAESLLVIIFFDDVTVADLGDAPTRATTGECGVIGGEALPGASASADVKDADEAITGANDDVTGAKEAEAANVLSVIGDDTVGDIGGVLVDTIRLWTLLMGDGKAFTDRVDIAVGDMTRFSGFVSTVAVDGSGTVDDLTTEFLFDAK